MTHQFQTTLFSGPPKKVSPVYYAATSYPSSYPPCPCSRTVTGGVTTRKTAGGTAHSGAGGLGGSDHNEPEPIRNWYFTDIQ